MNKVLVAYFDDVVLKLKEKNEELCQRRFVEPNRICICCGREIKDLSKAKSLRLILGGECFTESEIDFDESSDLGWWYVGLNCYKKFKANICGEIEV